MKKLYHLQINEKLKLLNELDNLVFNIEIIKLSIGEGNE